MLAGRTQGSLLAGAAFLAASAYAYNSVVYGDRDRELADKRMQVQQRKEDRKDKSQEARSKMYSATKDAISARIQKHREE